MRTLLARIRSLTARTVGIAVLVTLLVLFGIAAVFASTDTLLGLVELTLYITGILALSAAVTYAVIRLSPTKSKSKSAETS